MRPDLDEDCHAGCFGCGGVALLGISALGAVGAYFDPSVVGIGLSVLGVVIGLAITIAGFDGTRPVAAPGPRRKVPTRPAPIPQAVVPPPEPAWTRGGPVMCALIEARTRLESVFLAVLAAAFVQALAMAALFARCGAHSTMAALGAVAFLPVALAPLTAARRDAGDCAVTTATVVAALGGACNIGLAMTVWFAAPPFGAVDPVMFASHPGRDFLWSPFAGAGGPWFLSGLATLLVARASRPGGLPGASVGSREAAAWWMNGVPLLSLLAYGFTLDLASR